ncbi:hypothetical protein AYO46_00315 [Betaproteobacteria bacterium SCGC AG-212-J23]|nr:hypothetical protein AYO46_00315 [Betaproteobacteria bacterium SCGC AG-212-J23]
MEYAQLNPTDTNIHRTSEEIKDEARATFEEATRYAKRSVRENPWTAVGISFGAGVVFGALITLALVTLSASRA